MGIKSWLWNLLKPEVGMVEVDLLERHKLESNLYYRKLAFWSCVRIIGNAVSKVRWRTFLNGEEVEGDDYFQLNIQPNQNQNSTAFYQSLIGKLFLDNEALVIRCPLTGGLVIADSYEKREFATRNWLFDRVTVGDWIYESAFWMDRAIYLRLNNEKIKQLLDGAFRVYSELMDVAKSTYVSNRGRKGILNIETLRGGTEEDQRKEIDLYTRRFKDVFQAGNGLVLLERGKSYQDISWNTRGTETTRDIRELINDIYDAHAQAFGIPTVLLRGDVAGTRDAVDYLMTFGVEPVVDLIQTELTAKLYGAAGYKRGSRVIADTTMVKHMSLADLGVHVDKLIGSGLYSLNEVRRKLNEPAIPEPWADEHWMTLNYQAADRVGEQPEEETRGDHGTKA